MWYVYSIYSNDGRAYCGISEHPIERLTEHNAGKCKTTAGGHWRHAFVIAIGARDQAYLVERWFKHGHTRTKRELIISLYNSEGDQKARAAIMEAANKWREKVIARNRRGDV